MDFNLDTGSFITETVSPDDLDENVFAQPERSETPSTEDTEEARALGLWLRALVSFFKVRNHPFSETEQTEAATRDWASELRIARRCLLQSAQLALSLSKPKPSVEGSTV